MSYYESNADAFIAETLRLDMSDLYKRFLPHVRSEGSILDAGCGSGRDARAFQDMGYSVSAFDASEAMCRHASALLGKPVMNLKFQDVRWVEEFDGIWACASLLHVAATELEVCLSKLTRALKRPGALYVSFKYGTGERTKAGRIFLDLDERALEMAVAANSDVFAVDTWVTSDRRPQRDHELWLNAIVQKR